MGRVQAQIARDGSNWRLELDAEHLAGRIELRGVNLGRGGSQIEQVRARLSRLQLPKQEADSVTQLMDPAASASTSPLPALDIEVDDFELRGKRLGRLEVQAQVPPGAREWKLDRLLMSSPDATLSASGRWGGTSGGRRRTELDWKLEVADAGKLLERLGQGQVLRGGKGQLHGQLGWTGSPLDPHYPSMAGTLNLQLDTGTFLKAEPGVGRLL
ncbi:MAG: TIGR02099 family protein, partial [Azospira oryzae]